MNKKGLIVLVVIISMFMLVGCGKKDNEKKSTDKEIIIGTSFGDLKFTYPKSRSFSVVNNISKGENNSIIENDTIYNNDLAIKIDVSVGDMGIKYWNEQIKYLKDNKMYEEYKLKNHEAYIMDANDKTLEARILIDSNKKYDEAYVLAITVNYMDPPEEKANIKKLFEDQIIKDFFNTIKLEKTRS